MLKFTLAIAAAAALATTGSAQMAGQGTSTTKAAPPAKSMATHTTKSGKKITYDCTKKGNANKAACKK